MKKVRWKCVDNKGCTSKCEFETTSTGKPTVCPVDGNSARWKEVTGESEQKPNEPVTDCNQPETNCSQLPKLTAEVFDRPDCPAWAKYAAVDKCGSVRLFSHSPWLGELCWNWANGEVTKLSGVTFDASDWQKSLIKRPEKKTLPDWCKVGEWVWLDGEYHKIIEAGEDWFRTSWGDNTGLWGTNTLHHFKQAHLRPYNAEEMKALVGKVLEHDTGLYLVTAYDYRWNQVKIESAWREEEELLERWTIDTMPCGVFEHLEDGEWTR